MRPLFALTFLVVSPTLVAQPPDVAWPAYGRDSGNGRYAPITQIDRSNVRQLTVAWTYHTGEHGENAADGEDITFEATPILFEGALYLSTAFGKIIALDPTSGVERWTYDPQVPRDRSYSEVTSRGVSAWRDPEVPPGVACAARIFLGTIDARLAAVDAASGRPCAGFGRDGVVDLASEVGMQGEGDYQVTSPPAVVNGVVVVGTSIGDNWNVDTGDGIVRGYDARTGRRLWGWRPIPRDSAGFVAGAANAWAPIAADPERDLVFVPTSSPSPDFFGGLRPGDNRWANSVVALRASTGAFVWGFQTVYHDVWDLDLGAPPMLVTVRRDGRDVPAVVQGTKMGYVFVLHRETGEPLFPVEERTVPHGGPAGEDLSPTQPVPVLPEPLVQAGVLTAQQAWGITEADRAECRALLERARSDGPFTPPEVTGTVLFPGNSGGINWGGGAWDAGRGLVVFQVHHLGTLVELIPRERFEDSRRSGAGEHYEYARQRGAPYAMRRRTLISSRVVPCTPPPWATVAAVDLTSGAIRWQVPLGQVVIPGAEHERGLAGPGGPIVTAGGLVFIGASWDRKLRAFDVESGEELWAGDLPLPGIATPMTYLHGGRQYVVIAAGGHGKWGIGRGDAVVAFALPKR